MTAPGAGSGALLDGPRAPGVTGVVVVLALFAATGLDGPAPWQVLHGACTVGFCLWMLAHRRRRPWMAQAFAVAALGGALVAPGTGVGLLLVVGTTVLVRSVRRCWLATAIGVLVLGSVVGLTVSGVRPAAEASRSIWLMVALTVLLVVLDRITAATALADAATLHHGVDRDRARLGDELRTQIGRTLCAARQDIRAAIDTASAGERPTGGEVIEQLASLQSLVDDGIDQLGRLSTEPVAATLPDELHSAREVCERLGIVAVISADPVAERAVADAAALVLREAVT
ncbi:MAG: hypothetical protein ACRCZP_11055, partial [Phycicoccus sp.]